MTFDLARRVAAVMVLVGGVMAGPVVYAQVAQQVGAPVQPGAGSEWGGTIVWAFFSSSAMEWLKRNPRWTLFAEDATFYAQRAFGVVVAAAAAMGVHYTYDPHAGVLTVTGLTGVGLMTMAVETVRTWVIQEVIYRTTVKNYGKQ